MNGRKRKRKNAFNQRFFVRLMSSFGIMLLLPVLLSLANYMWSRNVLEEETNRYNQVILKQAQTVLDEKLQGIQMYAFELSQNEALIHFLGGNEMDRGDLFVEINRVKKQLQRFQALYPGVKSAVVYSVSHEVGISGMSASFEPWPQAAIKLLRGNSDAWNVTELSDMELDISKYLETENLYCRYVAFQRAEGEQRVLLVHSLPIWSSGLSYDGVLVAEVDVTGLLRSSGSSIEEAGGAFGILDQNGTLIGDVGKRELFESISSPLELTDRIVDDGTYYFVAAQNSAVNKWKYVIIQPDTSFVRKLRSNRNFTLVILTVLLILGGFLAYALSRTNYRPMKMIMEKLRRQSGRLNDRDGDEFTYIESALNGMEDSIQEVQAVMERQLPKIRSSVLQNLLTNTVTDYGEFVLRLKECGISYTEEAYTVAMVHVQQFPTEQMKTQALLKELLWGLLREITGNDLLCSMVELPDDNLALIVNGKLDRLKAEIQEYLQQLMGRARKELQILLVIAVGDPVERLEEIPSVYREAMIILGNQSGQENFGAVLTMEKKEAFRLYYCPVEVRNRISSYIMAGKEELACHVIDENYHENFDDREVNWAVSVGYFIMLIDTILNCYSVSEEAKQKLWDECNPVAALLLEETPETMVLIVKGFAQLVGHYVRQRKENHTDSVKNRILNYIREDYTNNDLSLSYVADHFFITPNYLSAFFKEQVGDTFLNYLTNLRINQAKRLLVETDYAVNVIAEKIGYASANTLIRTFKKIENMTPGEYRDYARQRAKK